MDSLKVRAEAMAAVQAATKNENVLRSELTAFGVGLLAGAKECDDLLETAGHQSLADWHSGYRAGVRAVRALLRARATAIGVE